MPGQSGSIDQDITALYNAGEGRFGYVSNIQTSRVEVRIKIRVFMRVQSRVYTHNYRVVKRLTKLNL